MEMQLLLADEADLILIGAQAVLKDRPDWTVIHTARSGGELLEAARRWQPDIILFNEHLDPLIDVLALVERLKHSAPPSRQIVLGNKVDGLLVRDLFVCGVLGYLFSGDDLGDCLIPALTTVMNNRPYLSPTANAEYLVAMKSPLRDWKLDSEARAMLPLLTRGTGASSPHQDCAQTWQRRACSAYPAAPCAMQDADYRNRSVLDTVSYKSLPFSGFSIRLRRKLRIQKRTEFRTQKFSNQNTKSGKGENPSSSSRSEDRTSSGSRSGTKRNCS